MAMAVTVLVFLATEFQALNVSALTETNSPVTVEDVLMLVLGEKTQWPTSYTEKGYAESIVDERNEVVVSKNSVETHE
ncbi:hypothetical protein C8R43DRAFT_1040739 [Mycena crocata]|nr:hypothetical protein C8R43DRAFT_1040739 [Mycena crocata]